MIRRSFACLAVASLVACSGTSNGTGGSSGSGSDDKTPSYSGGGSSSNPPAPSSSGSSGESSSGSSGTPVNDFDALFGPPSNPSTTKNAIVGVWAGGPASGGRDADLRLRVESNAVTIAIRCGSNAAIGVKVAAKVTNASIQIVESKTAGETYLCGIKVVPVQYPRCGTGGGYDCFTLDGENLSLNGELYQAFSSGSQVGSSSNAFTKLSD